ncbi:MAG: hydroxymethylbilane synthase [Deltaproteobacteria bacterium]|nr:hydroxymethylbilane synthase [Deltaproteobacteria bacterium]
MKLKLGTRRSLLAWSQSSWVAREVERLNPGFEVELVGIETRGDRIQDVPLQSVEGKDFFVAELDEALKSGRVDFTVHSMKDLSLDRPEWLTLAAVPVRADPRDVLIAAPDFAEKLPAGKNGGKNRDETVRIGTSSPRRLVNAKDFLLQALPRSAADPEREPKIELVEMRGNVNTRLSRLREPAASARQLDGVVLALAGLIRLHANEAAREELAALLRCTRFMIFPLRESPAAPAQGALAVECRAQDLRTRAALKALHHELSFDQVDCERAVLREWGGGCHQRFGAASAHHPELGRMLYVRGFRPEGLFVEEVRWDSPVPPAGAVRGWDGVRERKRSTRERERANSTIPRRDVLSSLPDLSGNTVFLSHSRALPDDAGTLDDSRVWTSGPASWKRLARRGIWVEGCAEETGFAGLKPLLAEPVLGLPKPILVLTHECALAGWKGVAGTRALATYAAADEALYAPQDIEKLKAATHVFWSSASQYHALKKHAGEKIHQACPAGKTLEALSRAGVAVKAFPSVKEWRTWLEAK